MRHYMTGKSGQLACTAHVCGEEYGFGSQVTPTGAIGFSTWQTPCMRWDEPEQNQRFWPHCR